MRGVVGNLQNERRKPGTKEKRDKPSLTIPSTTKRPGASWSDQWRRRLRSESKQAVSSLPCASVVDEVTGCLGSTYVDYSRWSSVIGRANRRTTAMSVTSTHFLLTNGEKYAVASVYLAHERLDLFCSTRTHSRRLSPAI